MESLRTFAGVVELVLLVGSAAVLAWFVWRVFVRKWWRLRRISNIRLKRILEQRQSGEGEQPFRDE